MYVCVCNCVCKVNFTVRQTIHIAIGGEIHIYVCMYTDVCEKDKESLRIQKALSFKMINLTYILIYEHVFAWYCMENICILYQKLKFQTY